MPDDATAADPETLLSLDEVEVRRGTFRLVLSGLSLRVGRGELVVVSGPCGAGKSTLMRLVAGQLEPGSGSIRVAGQDLGKLGPRARAHLRRRIGIVPQQTELFDDLSAIENVAAPALICGERRSDAVERARIALERVGLDLERIGPLRAGELSSGERRRIVLARALANRPALLLIDEPPVLEPAVAGAVAGTEPQAAVTSVDIDVAPAGSDRLFDLIGQFCRTGVAAIVVMREAVPAGSGARHYRLAEGRLQQARLE